MQIIITVSN